MLTRSLRSRAHARRHGARPSTTRLLRPSDLPSTRFSTTSVSRPLTGRVEGVWLTPLPPELGPHLPGALRALAETLGRETRRARSGSDMQ